MVVGGDQMSQVSLSINSLEKKLFIHKSLFVVVRQKNTHTSFIESALHFLLYQRLKVQTHKQKNEAKSL